MTKSKIAEDFPHKFEENVPISTLHDSVVVCSEILISEICIEAKTQFINSKNCDSIKHNKMKKVLAFFYSNEVYFVFNS